MRTARLFVAVAVAALATATVGAQDRVLNEDFALPEILLAAPSDTPGALVMATPQGVVRTDVNRKRVVGAPLVTFAPGERLIAADRFDIVAVLKPDGTGRDTVDIIRIKDGVASSPRRLTGPRGVARARQVWLGAGGPLILTRSDGKLEPSGPRPQPSVWRFWGEDGRMIRRLPNTDRMQVHPSRGGTSVALRGARRLAIYTATGQQLRVIDERFRYVALSDDGKRALLAYGDPGRIDELRVLGSHGVEEFSFGQPIHGVAIAPNGRTGLAWLQDRTLVQFDINERRIDRTWMKSPLGRKVFISRAHIDNRGDILLVVKSGREDHQRVWIARIRNHRYTHVGIYPVQDASRRSPAVQAVFVDRVVVRDRRVLHEVEMVPTTSAGTLVVPESRTPHPPVFIFKTLAVTISDPNLWPLVPQTEQHPVGTGLEYQSYGLAYAQNTIHEGVDILGLDATGERKDIAVTVSAVFNDTDSVLDGDIRNTYVLLQTDDRAFVYGHIEPGDLFDDAAERVRSGETIPARTVLGQVGKWESCGKDREDGFDHLHYVVKDTTDTGGRIDPLTTVSPYLDDSPPEFGEVLLCPDDHVVGAAKIQPTVDDCRAMTASTGCVAVTDAALRDVVMEIHDRGTMEAPGGHVDVLGFHDVKLRFCETANCDTEEPLPHVTFDRIPSNWTNSPVKAGEPLFLGPEGFRSSSDYCNKDEFRYVATNVLSTASGPQPSVEGSWDPTSLKEGFRTLTITARDFKLNEAVLRIPVCIHPSGKCDGKLIPRDCEQDNGVEPSPCEQGDASPDLSIVPPDAGTDGYVEACLRNVGCGAVPLEASILLEFTALDASTGDLLDSMTRVASAGGFGPRAAPENAEFADWESDDERCRRWSLEAGSAFASPGMVVTAEVTVGDDTAEDDSALRDNNRVSVKITSTPVP